MADSPRDQLEHFLVDVYAIEQQALAQMRTAPDIAGSPGIAAHFREHLLETEQQAELVRARLEAIGGSPSRVKDAVMRLGGKGFLLFARTQPDTPGKLVAHAHSYEALEYAAYEMLIRAARKAGDAETVAVATTIREQEGAMRDRLAGDFEEAVDASLEAVGKKPANVLPSYLADAHALEEQSIQLLKRGEKIAGSDELTVVYDQHVAESEGHARLIEQRLEALGRDTSSLKDIALRAGAVNWSLFFQAQKDTSAKLAAFVYAVEHLEIAGYELLRHVALRGGDAETVAICSRILSQERAMANRVLDGFDSAFAASGA